ncbi:phosphopantetheine-binding [Burkholderia ambifaria IOP40-10]|uniref:Acyl carrier protein n=1 Tax=Burkholderia ambifaria IOP40-10 TaxID=396596 RepID=B1FNZ6_9BURK|nr:phosphopantetheine-binding protein [Burkholderia ambifaria]EDT00721.1 phosphopantetheine-binding [Burkholderia ambifaria IOP40-10]
MIELEEAGVPRQTAESVKVLLSEILGGRPEEYSESLRLVEDLAMDSLELLDLAMALEDRYGIELESDDIFKLETIGDVVAHIAAHAA